MVVNNYSRPKVEQKFQLTEEEMIEENRKTVKADPFVDLRELKNEERKLNGEKLWKPMYNNTCMYFIQAVEEKKYGWFWECPNDGEQCPYYHKLPEDYQFKDEDEEELETRTLEEIIEDRRSKITEGTPVNEKTFKEWKERKNKEKAEKEEQKKKQRNKDLKSGHAKLTGREILLQRYEEQKFTEEDEGEEDFDIIALLKKKGQEEDEMDMENAKLITDIAQEFKDYVEPDEEELQKLIKGETPKENNEIKMEDGKTLLVKEVQVDVDLFKEDEIGDLPDDEDVEDVPEDQ